MPKAAFGVWWRTATAVIARRNTAAQGAEEWRPALYRQKLIDYRQSSMELTRDAAAVYAGWCRCLADPTRLLVLNLLACRGQEMSVGAIVDAVDVGQSTISHHLRVLGETGFVRVRREGNVSWWSVNERCIERFPSAAELVMGRVPPQRPQTPVPPWATEPEEASR